MSNEILRQLKELGMDYSLSTVTSALSNSIHIQNSSLRNALSETLGQNMGPILLRCPTDPSMYSRYHNGNISTQRRGQNGKFIQSQGFEEVQIGVVIDSLMEKITFSYACAIREKLKHFYEMTFLAVSQFQEQLRNQVIWASYTDKLDELNSINDDIHMILEDLPSILISPQASSGYHGQILNFKNRVKTILFFLKRNMVDKAKEIRETNRSVDTGELFYYYFSGKLALESYAICLFLDIVLSHRTDEDTKTIMIIRIQNMINRLNESDKILRDAPIKRGHCNSAWTCWTPYEQWQKQNENNAINWFFYNCQNNNTPIELKYCEEALQAGENALKSATIEILPD